MDPPGRQAGTIRRTGLRPAARDNRGNGPARNLGGSVRGRPLDLPQQQEAGYLLPRHNRRRETEPQAEQGAPARHLGRHYRSRRLPLPPAGNARHRQEAHRLNQTHKKGPIRAFFMRCGATFGTCSGTRWDGGFFRFLPLPSTASVHASTCGAHGGGKNEKNRLQ